MRYDLQPFWNCLPTKCQCVFMNPEAEVALHAARWPRSSFDSFADFVRFTYRYSCVLQPFINDPKRSDLDEWFHADPTADERADALMNQKPAENQDAREWMTRFYPPFSIEWLNAGIDGKIISLTDGEWPEMLGYDTEGFFNVFAADII